MAMNDLIIELIDEAGTIKELEESEKNIQRRAELVAKFTSILKQTSEINIDDIRGTAGETLLQKLCDETLSNYIEILFDDGTPETNSRRANAVGFEGDSDYPILKATSNGDANTLKLLIAHGADITKAITHQNETVLHCLLEKGNDDTKVIESQQECLNILLGKNKFEDEIERKRYDQICQIVNKKDKYGNTAMYYASHKWPADIVLALLKHGAKLSMNKDNDSVIRSISPDTLEEFLNNDCLKTNFQKKLEETAIEKDIHIGHSELEITFDYSFLKPSSETFVNMKKYETSQTGSDLCCCNPTDKVFGEEYVPCEGKDNDIEAVPVQANSPQALRSEGTSEVGQDELLAECEPLWHLSQSKEHCRLLKHPVIASFLALKWIRIRQYYNRNLRFYAFFVFILTRHILYGMDNDQGRGQTTCNQQSHWFYFFNAIFILAMILFTIHDMWLDREEKMSGKDGNTIYARILFKSAFLLAIVAICIAGLYFSQVFWWTLVILIILLSVRELFQFVVSIPRYVESIENWMEIALITAVFSILFNGDNNIQRQSAAFAIILSWIELIILVGKHPASSRMNIYVTMLLKVTSSFFSFLLVYVLFILAFGLGFYVSFEKLAEDSPESKSANCTSQSSNSDDYEPFSTGLQSFIKTSAMFSGELEFGDLMKMIKTHPSFMDYLFFLTFLFFVVIILMNLLTGLAVSDVTIIKEQAEIIAYKSQVDLICTAEAILLDDPFNFLSNNTKCEWINRFPTPNCWRRVRAGWSRIRSCIYKAILPIITCSFTPRKAAERILLLNQKDNGKNEDTFTIKPNERVCLGYLTGTRLFDYKAVVVPAKEIILKISEKKQVVDLETLLGDVNRHVAKFEECLTYTNKKIDEMARQINEKLDKLLK